MEDLGSIWELYGLRANPFSTNPLLVKGGILPLDCFYGRNDELNRIAKMFRSEGGTRMLIVGEPGVGKTTLVNFARSKAIENGFFSPFQEIKVQSEWTGDDLILNTLCAIYSTLKLLGENPDTKKLVEKLKHIVDLYEIKDRDFSVNAFGTGLGYDEARTVYKPSMTSSFILELFQESIEDLKKAGYREIILHYNNFELLEEDEGRLKNLLNQIRDFLQTPNVHFIFVGSKGLPAILQGIPRVSAIFQDTPIKLDSISKTDLLSVIEKRIEVLKIPNLNTVKPCTNNAVLLLYKIYDGNMRAIFNSISTAILETVKDTPITLDDKHVKAVLSTVAKKRFTSKLSPAMQKVLNALIEAGEATNKQLSEKTGMAPQNISKYLKDLSNASCVFMLRSEGKEKFYAASDWVKWVGLDA
ncbi:AAA family ATPase [Candidatus Micrarchaeota archaeon]|nr:AAA family ATPase [Candidatus Micrarchaeota archaeon]